MIMSIKIFKIALSVYIGGEETELLFGTIKGENSCLNAYCDYTRFLPVCI